MSEIEDADSRTRLAVHVLYEVSKNDLIAEEAPALLHMVVGQSQLHRNAVT